MSGKWARQRFGREVVKSECLAEELRSRRPRRGGEGADGIKQLWMLTVTCLTRHCTVEYKRTLDNYCSPALVHMPVKIWETVLKSSQTKANIMSKNDVPQNASYHSHYLKSKNVSVKSGKCIPVNVTD